MMPWEHALVGYIGYSLFVHAIYGDSPTSKETPVVVFASVLPDLIDKPLAWWLGVFDSGYTIGHSIFFAVPLSIAVGLYTSSRGRPRIGWAFGIGYLLHLPADVFPTYLHADHFPVHRILWPVSRDNSGQDTTGDTGDTNGTEFGEALAENIFEHAIYVIESPTAPRSLLMVGVVVFGFLLWLYDGMPVGRDIFRYLRRITR